MTYYGILTDVAASISDDGFKTYVLDENLRNLFTNWLQENSGTEQSIRVLFVDSDVLEASIKYSGEVSYFEEYDEYFFMSTNPGAFKISSYGEIYVGSGFSKDYKLFFTKFSKEECEEFNVPYISLELEDD